MAAPYEFFDHTADIGVHVSGGTLAELFANAARAMYDALGKFALGEHRPPRFLKLRADSLEDLLHDWLAELLFDLETHQGCYDQIEITEIKPGYLAATLQGGTIDFSRSQPAEEIKAVTYHQLRVTQQADGTWRATVIFDV